MKSSHVEVPLWTRTLHQRPSERSVVTPELLLLPERQSRLTRIDPETGADKWSVHVKNTWGWLAHSSERVYYLNQHDHLQCHAMETGESLWTADLGGIRGWLQLAGQVLLVGGWRGYTPLAGLDTATGSPCWQLDWLGRRRIAQPIVGPWGIAAADLDASVVQFRNPNTGVLTREVPLPAIGHEPDATPLLRCYGDVLVLAGRDGACNCLDSSRSSWDVLFRHAEGIATIAPPIVGDDVLFMDNAGRLNCYRLRDGAQRWTAPWHHGTRDRLPVALSSAGLLAVGSSDGRVSVFDQTGRQVWSRVLAKRIETDLAWTNDHSLVAGTTGALVALRPSLGGAKCGDVGTP